MRQQHLSLARVPLQQLQLEALREQLLAVLPHLLQLGPALAQRLEALPQEHVLRVVLGRRFLINQSIVNAIIQYIVIY